MTAEESKALANLETRPGYASPAIVSSEAARDFVIKNQGTLYHSWTTFDLTLEDLGADLVRITATPRRTG